MTAFMPSKRDFLKTTGAAATSIILPREVIASLKNIDQPVKIGLITDLHH